MCRRTVLYVVLILACAYVAQGICAEHMSRSHTHSFILEDDDALPHIKLPGCETDVVLVGGNVIENKKVELVPILRPSQNLHDCVKQLILLEAHLFDPERTCWQCVDKHFLTIQALLEEAHSLVTNDGDERKKLPVPTNIQALEQAVRRLHIKWHDSDRSPRVRHGIACELRQIRKALMKDYSRPLCN
jgi:hypothetical protein